MAEDCIFCKIIRGDIPGEFVHADDDVVVLRDIAPKAPVHLLIIPKKHFTYLTGLTSEFEPVIGRMFAMAQQMAAREGVSDSGYRLIINQGSDSGQEVPHLHLHLLGGKRLGGMG